MDEKGLPCFQIFAALSLRWSLFVLAGENKESGRGRIGVNENKSGW